MGRLNIFDAILVRLRGPRLKATGAVVQPSGYYGNLELSHFNWNFRCWMYKFAGNPTLYSEDLILFIQKNPSLFIIPPVIVPSEAKSPKNVFDINQYRLKRRTKNVKLF